MKYCKTHKVRVTQKRIKATEENKILHFFSNPDFFLLKIWCQPQSFDCNLLRSKVRLLRKKVRILTFCPSNFRHQVIILRLMSEMWKRSVIIFFFNFIFFAVALILFHCVHNRKWSRCARVSVLSLHSGLIRPRLVQWGSAVHVVVNNHHHCHNDRWKTWNTPDDTFT